MLPVDSDTLWGFCTPSRLAIPRNVFHSFVLKILCKTYQEIRTSKLNLAKPFVRIIQHNLPDSLREKSFIGSL